MIFGVKRTGDLDLWPFDLELVQNVTRGTDDLAANFDVLLRLLVVELWAIMHQTDDVTSWHWPLTFDPNVKQNAFRFFQLQRQKNVTFNANKQHKMPKPLSLADVGAEAGGGANPSLPSPPLLPQRSPEPRSPTHFWPFWFLKNTSGYKRRSNPTRISIIL